MKMDVFKIENNKNSLCPLLCFICGQGRAVVAFLFGVWEVMTQSKPHGATFYLEILT